MDKIICGYLIPIGTLIVKCEKKFDNYSDYVRHLITCHNVRVKSEAVIE